MADCGFIRAERDHVHAFVDDFARFERCGDEAASLVQCALRNPEAARAIAATWTPQHRSAVAATVRDLCRLRQLDNPRREWVSLRADANRALGVLSDN